MSLRQQASPQQPPPAPLQKARGCVPDLTRLCKTGLCTLWLTGCTGAPVRPPRPPPADCPPGAVAVMEALDIGRECALYLTDFRRDSEDEVTNVPLGRITYKVAPGQGACGTLPAGTRVSGAFFLGTVRGKTVAIARLTQAQTPEGKTFPVCLRNGTSYNSGGEEVIRPGDKPGTVVIREWTNAYSMEEGRFE